MYKYKESLGCAEKYSDLACRNFINKLNIYVIADNVISHSSCTSEVWEILNEQ